MAQRWPGCMWMKNWIINCTVFLADSCASEKIAVTLSFSKKRLQLERYLWSRKIWIHNEPARFDCRRREFRSLYHERVYNGRLLCSHRARAFVSVTTCLPWALSVKCENMRTRRQATNATRSSRGGSWKMIRKKILQLKFHSTNCVIIKWCICRCSN